MGVRVAMGLMKRIMLNWFFTGFCMSSAWGGLQPPPLEAPDFISTQFSTYAVDDRCAPLEADPYFKKERRGRPHIYLDVTQGEAYPRGHETVLYIYYPPGQVPPPPSASWIYTNGWANPLVRWGWWVGRLANEIYEDYFISVVCEKPGAVVDRVTLPIYQDNNRFIRSRIIQVRQVTSDRSMSATVIGIED